MTLAALFEMPSQPSQRWPASFSPYPLTKRPRGVKPTHLSFIPRETDINTALIGMNMLGLELTRQGEDVAAVLEAKQSNGLPRYSRVVIQLPRRATKTTSIWSVILGRCYLRPGTKVITTAQDGTRARNRFMEVIRALERIDFQGVASPSNRLGTLRRANGDESIEFDNGSRIWVVTPDPSAFRGEAADMIVFDEAGEISGEKGSELLQVAAPLMDTRPSGQIIITGTPGKRRAGMFWDALVSARSKTPGYGIVDFSIKDNESLAVYDEAGEVRLNRPLLKRVHPGLSSGLTTWRAMESAFDGGRNLETFNREYGCLWPMESRDSAISSSDWEACSGGPDLPDRPDRLGLAFDVSPDSSWSSLVAAWRDEEGRAHIEVLASRAGADWIPEAGRRASKKYRVPIACDSMGANADPAERLQRLRTSVRYLRLKDMQAAAARLAAEIQAHTLRHYEQGDLDLAVEGAAWRYAGEGGRLFARKQSDNDVTPLVAASIALQAFDRMPQRSSLEIVRAGA